MAHVVSEEYRSLTPYLTFSNASAAIDFYKRALGATEICRLPMPDGKIGHAELTIGNSRIMLSDESLEWDNKSPRTLGGSPIKLHLYTEDVDSLAARFVGAGGREIMPIKNQFYGDRSGQFEDPEGYRWTLAQHLEDVAPDEMARRMQQMFSKDAT